MINKKAIDFKSQFRNLSSIQSMVLCAFFAALYIVLGFFEIRLTSDIQFRPGYLTLAAAGMYGGPVMGALTGAAGDVIGMLITGGKGEVFFFGFTASYALMGFLFGLVLYGGAITLIRTIAAALAEFLVSLFLNTYWLMTMYYNGTNYISLLMIRLPKCVIMLVIGIVVLTITMKALHNAFKQARLLPE